VKKKLQITGNIIEGKPVEGEEEKKYWEEKILPNVGNETPNAHSRRGRGGRRGKRGRGGRRGGGGGGGKRRKVEKEEKTTTHDTEPQ